MPETFKDREGTMIVILKFFIIAAGITMVFFAAAAAWRSSRRLNQRITTFKEELEEKQNQPGPINPYAAMADLYNEEGPGAPPVLPPRSRRQMAGLDAEQPKKKQR